jgi:hypothetical protein
VVAFGREPVRFPRLAPLVALLPVRLHVRAALGELVLDVAVPCRQDPVGTADHGRAQEQPPQAFWGFVSEVVLNQGAEAVVGQRLEVAYGVLVGGHVARSPTRNRTGLPSFWAYSISLRVESPK